MQNAAKNDTIDGRGTQNAKCSQKMIQLMQEGTQNAKCSQQMIQLMQEGTQKCKMQSKNDTIDAGGDPKMQNAVNKWYN